MTQGTATRPVELVVRRTYGASIDKVFDAWVNPSALEKWFSPNGRFRSPIVDTECKPGGTHNITMRHSDGETFEMFGKYIDIVPNERVSFTWIYSDDPTQESIVTVEFLDTGAGTELVLTHCEVRNQKLAADFTEGWNQCLDVLELFLAGGSPLLK